MTLDPPTIILEPALRWALVRAFGPLQAIYPRPPDPAEVVAMARRFDLAARIGGRHPLSALARELGGRAAAQLAMEHAIAREVAVRLGALAKLVAETAEAAQAPIALLKFGALRASGRVGDGLRRAGDVDLLVPEERAEALARLLTKRGLAPSGFRDEPHHLAQMRNADGYGVELHVHVPFVCVSPERRNATYSDLMVAGLLEPSNLSGTCSVPCIEVLVAHAIVHALAHHREPGGYPPFRMVGDLVDLGAFSDQGLLGNRARPFAADAISATEWCAALALARRLAEADGALFEAELVSTGEGLLLRHLVAGVLAEDYRSALRLRSTLGAERSLGGWLEAARRAVFLTHAQIDVIYGRPRSRLGYLGWSVLRPFDLLRRVAKYAAQALRHRFNR